VNREDDTPRAAFSLLPWRISLFVLVALIASSALAWRSTIEQAGSMSGMVMGLGQIGSRVQGSMSATLFLTMWVTMMAAMMLPTVAPMVLAHRAVSRRRGDGAGLTLVFVAGYLLIWSAIGVVPLFVYWGFARLDEGAANSSWLPTVAGAILILAGLTSSAAGSRSASTSAKALWLSSSRMTLAAVRGAPFAPASFTACFVWGAVGR